MVKRGICWIVIVAFLVQIVGCYSSKIVSMREIGDIEKARKVVITTKDGKEYELEKVKVEYPKIKGYQQITTFAKTLVELNVEEIQSVKIQNINVVKTSIGLSAVSAIMILGFLYIANNMHTGSIGISNISWR
jgi:hypothetical protein